MLPKPTLLQRLKAVRLDERLVSRTALAYLMILVASLGAGTAFWIAHDEQKAARFIRQLTHGQMVEVGIRQDVVGDWGIRASLEERQRSHQSRAQDLADTANRVRPTDPQQAGQLDMLAQQEQMLANLTGTLLVPFRDWESGAGSTAERLGNVASRELANLGFASPPGAEQIPDTPAAAGTDSHPPTFTHEAAVHARLLPVWRRIAERIHVFEADSPNLALAVVFFVVALALLTIADLTQRWVRTSNLAVLAGMASALGALVFAIRSDPTVWTPLVPAVLFILLLGALFRALGMFEQPTRGETPHTPELEPRQYSGTHLFLRKVHNLREQFVILLIALTVLLSSVTGLWYTQANTQVSEATHYAFDTQAALNNMDGERWLLGSAGAITPTLEFFSVRMRCAYASQAAVLPPADASPTMIAMLARDRERDCAALQTPENQQTADFVDRADFDSGASPGVRVLAEIHNRGPFNPFHLYALADGYVSLAERWETKATLYILTLMLFAIAVYLFGHSLGMDEAHPSIALAVSGCVVLGVTIASAVIVHRDPVMTLPARPPSCPAEVWDAEATPVEKAAKFYGDALAQYEAATTSDDYQKAADLFACALVLRPDFGRAQYDRSRADSLIGQGDVDSRYSNFPTRGRIEEIATSDAQRSLALHNAEWTPTPAFLNTQGFNTELAGIATDKLSTIRDGLTILAQAISEGGLTGPDGKTLDASKVAKASASDLSVYRMLLTNTGLGQLAMGDRAGAAKSYQDAVDGLHLADDRDLVASSLSDLNTLEGHCADLYGASAASKCPDIGAGIIDARRMLLVGRSGAVSGSGYARITDINTWVRASRVAWSASVTGFDPDRDTLSVVWSAYSDDWKVWRVVQPLFKPVDPKSLAGTGRVVRVTIYNNFPSNCLPPGTYRAEFFVNGVRVAGGGNDKGTALSGYQNYRSREMDIAFCGSVDWTPSSFPEDNDGRQLARKFTTKGNDPALFLFTFFSPKTPIDPETRSPVTRAWHLLERLKGWTVSDEQFYAAASRFTGCQNPIQPGTVLWRWWAASDGLVHVALLMGDSAPNGQACQVLESIGAYYDRDEKQLLGQNQ